MKKFHSVSAVDHSFHLLLPLFLCLLLFAGYRSCGKVQSHRGTSGGSSHVTPKKPPGSGVGGITTLALSQAPKQVRQLIGYLKRVKHFNPPKGFRGGRVFRNREGALPKGKTYYEYDVHPTLPGTKRGAERLVVDQQKQSFYYTNNHYRTFEKIIVK